MMIKRRDITIACCTINWSCGRKWRRRCYLGDIYIYLYCGIRTYAKAKAEVNVIDTISLPILW